MKNRVLMNIIRWSARIIGTLIVAFTLFMGIGEMIEGSKSAVSEINLDVIIIFAVWGLGLLGLLLALWKEGLGGLISLLCFVIFNILTAVSPESGYTYILLLFMIPSVLYLLYWWLKRKSIKDAKQ